MFFFFFFFTFLHFLFLFFFFSFFSFFLPHNTIGIEKMIFFYCTNGENRVFFLTSETPNLFRQTEIESALLFFLSFSFLCFFSFLLFFFSFFYPFLFITQDTGLSFCNRKAQAPISSISSGGDGGKWGLGCGGGSVSPGGGARRRWWRTRRVRGRVVLRRHRLRLRRTAAAAARAA